MTRTPSILGPRGLRIDPCWLAQPIVVAVSGGIDSIVLLDCLVKHPDRTGALTIAHVNYRLRAAADADAAWVQALAATYAVPCRVHTVPRAPTAGRQAWARQVRYTFFRRVARAIGAPAVAVAHQADDHAETVLLQLCRGTGLAGLAGVAATRALADDCTIVRPLWPFTRAQIARYAARTRLTWREDATNATTDYTRNRARHEVLPALATLNIRAAEHLRRVAESAREADEALTTWTTQLAASIVVQRTRQRRTLRAADVAPWPVAVQKRLLQLWYAELQPGRMLTADHLEQMAAVVCGADRRYTLPGPATIRRIGDDIQIATGRLPAAVSRGKRLQ